ncbi:uncharacterized protein EDB91DRAFT_149505 [Suillus paluster]|uniref:uncharacterized protein n=1 Tax=Suillus paluster TaxID=48578 RepID=UPI001B883BB8|nr:uncharacterized protein EDB91DRAFT_149505 [Suillus paluster]KAG1745452.1 hypothetical protein EDB91DRAFT_149505 [Suillus paluster]
MMSEDNRLGPSLGACRSGEATAGETSVHGLMASLSLSAHGIHIAASGAFFIQRKPRREVWQSVQKVAKGLTKTISKRFKSSRNRVPIVQNVVREGALSNQHLNTEDASHLHVAIDDQHPTMSENSSGYVNQALSREPASQVQAIPSTLQEGTSHQLVDFGVPMRL